MTFFKWQKKGRLLLIILKHRRHSRIGHIIRHNEFVVNILEGQTSGKGCRKTWTKVLKASFQKHIS
jgi:hypothetical protein